MVIDATKLTIFGIPPYMFFVGIGALVTVTVYEFLLLHYRLDITRGNRTLFFALPGILIGAKFFGIMSNVIDAWYLKLPFTIAMITQSGIVFYGGLILFLLIYLFMSRKYPPDEQRLLRNCLAVCIPLFHAFGRIGCLTAGCCYGNITTSIVGITYTTWVNGVPMTANRVPVQLYEAIANLLLFGLLLILLFKKREKLSLLKVYVLLYACIRFCDEFLRGDISKQVLHGFSASQAISVVLIIFVIAYSYIERKKTNVERI